MPALVCLGLIAFFVELGDWEGAFLLAAGFDSFLRTGEMLSLTVEDVLFHPGSELGVIKLAHTKTGQRHAAFEATTVLDPLVSQLWSIVLARLEPNAAPNNFVYFRPKSVFHKRFVEGCAHLRVAHFGLRVYSLRRGGATSFFRRTGSMSLTVERGRWGSIRPARIYINDGLAKAIDLQVTEETAAWIKAIIALFLRSLEQNLAKLVTGHQWEGQLYFFRCFRLLGSNQIFTQGASFLICSPSFDSATLTSYDSETCILM